MAGSAIIILSLNSQRIAFSFLHVHVCVCVCAYVCVSECVLKEQHLCMLSLCKCVPECACNTSIIAFFGLLCSVSVQRPVCNHNDAETSSCVEMSHLQIFVPV